MTQKPLFSEVHHVNCQMCLPPLPPCPPPTEIGGHRVRAVAGAAQQVLLDVPPEVLLLRDVEVEHVHLPKDALDRHPLRHCAGL